MFTIWTWMAALPDTAFDTARMAWNIKPSAWALNMMTRCLKPYHIEGELLPQRLTGIKTGLLSVEQMLETARIEFNYYERSDLRLSLASLF